MCCLRSFCLRVRQLEEEVEEEEGDITQEGEDAKRTAGTIFTVASNPTVLQCTKVAVQTLQSFIFEAKI